MEGFALSIPGTGLGSGMYDMSYTTEKLPVSEVSHKASQLDEGGSGFSFDVNAALKDLAGVWLARESQQNQWPNQVQQTPYLRAQDGTVYPAGQYTQPPMSGGLSMGTVVLLGAALVAVIVLARG